jgi:choline dehydrogenase-like flavoprotein
VMPTIIRGHTHAPSLVIGERAADLILAPSQFELNDTGRPAV